MDTDRNLLFAVLALQAGIIDRDHFIEACALWATRKEVAIGELLIERGWLSADARAVVEKLLEFHLRRHGGDARASLSAAARPEARDALASVADGDVQQSVAALRSSADAAALADQFMTVPPSEPEGVGRNIIFEEIGHGGMGRVMRGRDTALRRELAVKVLREEYGGNAEAERRFIEEAQIGGQLQHPGIVPVYELGRFPDRRPFFTMKLVKGRTLADLLKERPDVRHDQARFLTIFEQVCQTVAYAHSKGVVHRDLKPVNVMVGAFGEVQVMDWGLAKVLLTQDATDPNATVYGTRIRTVRSDAPAEEAGKTGPGMGTPAFMPPEQMRGEVEAIDERADVFGLGGILCVILTGKPPYTGATSGEVMRKAATGELVEAVSRLEGCGADPDVVELCRACLAPEREARQRDAGEVARWMAAHQAGVQERLRKAELERAAAQARAEEAKATAAAERKAWRRTKALALLLLAALGASGWWVYAGHAEVGRLARQADASYDRGEYSSALAQVNAAQTHANYLPFAGGVRESLLHRRDEAESRLRQADFQKKAAAAEYHILGVADLFAPPRAPDQAVRRYERGTSLAEGIDLSEQALSLYGLPAGGRGEFGEADVRGLHPREITALRGRAAELMILLGLALEQRSREAPAGGAAPGDDRRRALECYLAAEEFGAGSRFLYLRRAALREALNDPGAADDQTKAEGAPADSFLDMRLRAADLVSGRRWDEAITEYRAAAEARPDEYWTRFRLAAAYGGLRKWDRAYQAIAECKRLRGDAATYNESAFYLSQMGRWEEAAADCREAIRQDPGFILAYTNLAQTHGEMGRVTEAVAVLRSAEEVLRIGGKDDLEGRPQRPHLHNDVGMAYERAANREVGAWPVCSLVGPSPLALAVTGVVAALERKALYQAAESHFATAVRLDPDHAGFHHNLAVVLEHEGRGDDAEREARRATELAPDDGDYWFALGFMCHSREHLDDARSAYGQAIAQGSKDHPAPEYLAKAYLQRCQVHIADSGLLEAQGHLKEAQARLKEALDDQNEVVHLTPGPEAFYTRAKIYALMEKYPAALDDLNLLVKMEPRDVRFIRMRGEMWGRLSEFDPLKASFNDLSDALTLDPNDPTIWHNRGNTLVGAKRWGEAIRDFNECLRRLPPPTTPPEKARRATTLTGLSFASVELGDLQLTLRASEGVLRLEPDVPPRELARALVFRALAHLRLGDARATLNDLEHVQRVDPEGRETYLVRALANQRLGNLKEALADLNFMGRNMPKAPQTIFARGLFLYLNNKETPQAIKDLTSAAENKDLDLFRPFAITFRARAFLRLGEDGAIAAARDAELLARILPPDDLAHRESARLLVLASQSAPRRYREEMVREAIAEVEQFVQSHPELRSELGSDEELKPLADQPAFKRLLEKR